MLALTIGIEERVVRGEVRELKLGLSKVFKMILRPEVERKSEPDACLTL